MLVQSGQIGQRAGAHNLCPGLVGEPGGRRIGVRVVQAHAACQQEAPHRVVDQSLAGQKLNAKNEREEEFVLFFCWFC